MRNLLLALLAGALLATAPTAGARDPGIELMINGATYYTASESYVPISMKAIGSSNVVHPRMVVTLPDGMSWTGVVLSNRVDGFDCSASAIGDSVVDCTYEGTLPANSYPVIAQVWYHTAVDAPLGFATVEVTAESAEYPLPAQPDCVELPNYPIAEGPTTGCAFLVGQMLQSKNWLQSWVVAATYRDPVSDLSNMEWEPGQKFTVGVVPNGEGYLGALSSPLRVYFELPPKISFIRMTSFTLPGFSCSATVEGDHELVTCTLPGVASAVNGTLWRVDIETQIEAGVSVPGPLQVYASIGNGAEDVQPSACHADPYLQGCARLTIHTRTARVADLQVSEIRHAPDYFTVGESGNIEIRFRNDGDGAAERMMLKAQLPRGLAIDSVQSQDPSAAYMTCLWSGNAVTTGQTLSCRTPTEVGATPPGQFMHVNLRVAVAPEVDVPGPVAVVAGIDQAALPSDNATLLDCIDAPDQPQCGYDEIVTWLPCAAQYGADGIYCDGFEEILPFIQNGMGGAWRGIWFDPAAAAPPPR